MVYFVVWIIFVIFDIPTIAYSQKHSNIAYHQGI